MDNKQKISKQSEVIDLLHVFKTLIKRLWAILLITVLVGGLAFGYTALFVKPKYSASVMLYVNNSAFDVGNVSISASELSAAQSLVDTYVVILNTRTTMEMVKEDTGVTDSWQKLLTMIQADAVNGTEVFKVTVTSTSPEKAAAIANSIAKVLPDRVESIIEGTTVEVVDAAIVNKTKVSPNITKNTVIGLIAGFIIGCAFFAFFAILDDTIRSEDHVIENYDLPVLAKIPNLLTENKGYYGHSYYNDYAKEGEANE